MREAYVMYSIGCVITPTELDEMPQDLVDLYMLLRDVADVAAYGGTLKL